MCYLGPNYVPDLKLQRNITTEISHSFTDEATLSGEERRGKTLEMELAKRADSSVQRRDEPDKIIFPTVRPIPWG